jgi:hypothetical protein
LAIGTRRYRTTLRAMIRDSERRERELNRLMKEVNEASTPLTTEAPLAYTYPVHDWTKKDE